MRSEPFPNKTAAPQPAAYCHIYGQLSQAGDRLPEVLTGLTRRGIPADYRKPETPPADGGFLISSMELRNPLTCIENWSDGPFCPLNQTMGDRSIEMGELPLETLAVCEDSGGQWQFRRRKHRALLKQRAVCLRSPDRESGFCFPEPCLVAGVFILFEQVAIFS